MKDFKAALFDLDGVIFDTEPQYTLFWGSEFRRYYPDRPGLEEAIKGQTLTQIYDKWFSGPLDTEREALTERLDAFEAQMDFPYVKGAPEFVRALREKGLRTAVVTSSNHAKMQNVFHSHPEFTALFDRIVTAEDIARSKPAPDCYLKGAGLLGADPSDCLAFEDSFNGLKAALDAGTTVIALTTAHPASELSALSHLQIPDYTDAFDALERLG
ncbi:MAG: HAD family phosphatase [Bacteroidales bacterium]|nr:HAD family phosphatase [Bacteroidales bacterium]